MHKVQGIRLQGILGFEVCVCDKRRFYGQGDERAQDGSYTGADVGGYRALSAHIYTP